MMTKKIFITATDTNAGKTYITSGLLQAANHRGLKTLGMKPVASGSRWVNGILQNEDALALMHAASLKLSYQEINPIAFRPATAPHLAASDENISLSAASLFSQTQTALSSSADLILIEGCGGWHTPLNSHETMADYARLAADAVVLVVGMRVGCLNHAILTEHAILKSGKSYTGWIANASDPHMPHQEEYLASLQQWLQAPLLGTVQFNEDPAKALATIIF